MRSAVLKGGVLALAAAVLAVGIVAGGTDYRFDSLFRAESVSAQTTPTSGPNSIASCGTGPLNGRTKGVVDAIMNELVGLSSNQLSPPLGSHTRSESDYAILPAISPSTACSAITNQYLGRFGRSYHATTGAISYIGTTTLLLQGLGLTQIRSADFGGIAGLGILDLSINDLTTIPASAFSELTNLRVLRLNSNKLTSINAGAFSGLGNLTTLYIGANKLTTLPETVLNPLTKLEILNLGSQGSLFEGEGNNIASLPAGLLTGLGELRVINAERMRLTSDGLAFLSTAVPKLEELNLRWNRLTSDGDGPDADLATTIFSNHTLLEELYLSGNQIKQLPDGIFTGMANLRRLELGNLQFGGNPLTTLQDGLFTGLSKLRIIYAQNTRITSVGANVFTVLKGLQGCPASRDCISEIYLSNGQLTTVPDGLFAGMTSLQQAHLDGHDLTTLPAGLFTGSTKLNVVKLGNNQLEAVPDDLFDFLTTRSGGFDALSNGLEVHLEGNKLTTLPAGIFEGSIYIYHVRLSDNQFSTLPSGIFTGLTNLQNLYLEGNRFQTLDAGLFTGLANLIVLHLNDNRISSLPATVFNGMADLRELQLNGNQLTALPEQIFSFISTRTGSVHYFITAFRVYLQDNSLTALPANIFQHGAGRKYFHTVDLTNNNISTLPTGVFTGLVSLTVLRLGDNSLTAFPSSPSNDLLPTFTAPFGLNTNFGELNLCGNAIAQSDLTALQGRTPGIVNLFLGDCPGTPHSYGGELLASCGSGHTLTGRTLDVVWGIMKATWPGGNPTRSASMVAAAAAASATLPQPSFFGPVQYSGGTVFNPSWQTALSGASGNPRACGSVTDADLARAQVVDFARFGASGGVRLTSLQADDFAGLPNLYSLRFGGGEQQGNQVTELPAGIFDDLTNLRYLRMPWNLLTTLPDGVFDDLTSLRFLDLSDNRLTSLPAGAFDNLGNLQQLRLDGNSLASLPASPFTNLNALLELDLGYNALQIEDFPIGIFTGLTSLRELILRDNDFESLPIERFAGAGMTDMRRLEVGQPHDVATDGGFAAFQNLFPSLSQFYFSSTEPFSEIPTPTPTPVGTATPVPTFTPTPTVHKRLGLALVSRIAPSSPVLTVPAGSVVHLSFALYNPQDAREDDLSMKDELAITWSAVGGAGSFSEPVGATGTDGDGDVDDRVVAWRAPTEPGRHTVTASFGEDYVCSDECTATFNITVVRAARDLVEPTPCPTTGLIPTSLTDTEGNAYAVFTPADGGEFTGDGITVSAGAGALEGCGIIGIRATTIPGEFTASHPGYTTAGDQYRLTAVNSQGTPFIRSFTTRAPLNACVPLPDRLRADISGLALLREQPDGSTQVLSSRVTVSTGDGLTLCGAVSELPSVVIAASRGIPQPMPTPTAVVSPTTPDTGGNAPASVAYVLLALMLGILAVAGAVRLMDRAKTSATRP